MCESKLNISDEFLEAVLSPLRILHNMENSSQTGLDLQPVDVWRCLNSLIQLRDYVNSNKLKLSDLENILTRDAWDKDVASVILSYASSEQSHQLALFANPSKYPPFRSLRCRMQITVSYSSLFC
ncbi:unnamed protein product [Gongylonema pulchrum]|uniref:COMM domain-containing protein n=1 Tax=Gongylonema pulchrum TaxID=637853 RepID=A0A183EBP0_9BILA|nr:unnamed protein product [Gongylonema pulchrum]